MVCEIFAKEIDRLKMKDGFKAEALPETQHIPKFIDKIDIKIHKIQSITN